MILSRIRRPELRFCHCDEIYFSHPGILSLETYTVWSQANGPLPLGDLSSKSWLLASPIPPLVNHSQTVSLCLGWMRNINTYNHQVKLHNSPYLNLIKSGVSFSQRGKGIYSLSKQLTSNRLWYYLATSLLIMHVKAHMPLNKDVNFAF